MQGKHAQEFSNELVDYWQKFSMVHPDFGLPKSRWDHTIPLSLHGDEGRGRLCQPVMVMSVQCQLPLRPGKSNMAVPFSFTSTTLLNVC